MTSLLALAVAAGVAAAPPGFVNGLCAPFVLGDRTAAALEADIRRYDARPVADADADSERPPEADVGGQMFRLPSTGSPAVFLDRRHGRCALVFPSASTPVEVRAEFAEAALPVGENGRPAAWRRVTTRRSGRPGPERFFMKIGADDGFGLCSAVAEDLRLRDGRPVTLVTVSVCRLLPTETLDNG